MHLFVKFNVFFLLVGEPYEISRDDSDCSGFNACLTSLGLVGVISTVTFICDQAFNIEGSQKGYFTDDADLEVDIFDDNPPSQKQGLTDFLKNTEYTRILWWPQKSVTVDQGKDRLQIWKASRTPTGGDLDPYELFGSSEEMMLYSYFMTLTGNIEDLDRVDSITAMTTIRFKEVAFEELTEKGVDDALAKRLVKLFSHINSSIFEAIGGIISQIPVEVRKACLPAISTAAVKFFNRIDVDESFKDVGYHGLPMDNTADDILVPTMWSEMWVPMTKCTQVTTLLRDFFMLKLDQTPAETNNAARTGNNGWELYATKQTSAWLAMSYSDGTDEWKDGAFRVDPYWFIHNSASYRDFYKPIWMLLKNNGIPFRLHWGKSFPTFEDSDITAKMLVNDQYPKLGQFLEFRAEKDPKGVFLNDYWCHWLGIPTTK